MTDRRDELAANLDAVRRRIEAAASAAGRDPAEVTLVAITKFFPASDVRLLAELGVTDVGENRHQEAQEKAAACADLELRWHFVGGLQSNKAAAVATYSDVVESVDRAKLVNPLNRGAHERSHDIDVLLQVSLDPPGREGRAGADPAELDALAAAVEQAGMLRPARTDGRRPARRGPRAGVRPARPDPPRAARRASRRHLALRGHERRPRGRRTSRRDTRAVGHGGPRSEAPQLVTSPTPPRNPGGSDHERRDAQDRRVPRPPRGHRPLRGRARRGPLRAGRRGPVRPRPARQPSRPGLRPGGAAPAHARARRPGGGRALADHHAAPADLQRGAHGGGELPRGHARDHEPLGDGRQRRQAARGLRGWPRLCHPWHHRARHQQGVPALAAQRLGLRPRTRSGSPRTGSSTRADRRSATTPEGRA